MPISGISQGLGIGGGATATISGAPGGGGASFIIYEINNSGTDFVLHSSGTVDYTVDWGDGTSETSTSNALTHNYAAGTYTINISSDVVYRPSFDRVGATGEDQITSITIQDGINLGTTLHRAWFGAQNMTTFAASSATSTVELFSDTWRDGGFTSFPVLDTSSGTNFSGAWYNCDGLTSFPAIDVSSGLNFSYAWYNCDGLTSFPALDASSGTNFQAAWSYCDGLTSFPALDASSGTNFQAAWERCRALTSFPSIDLGSGTNFQFTWRYCVGLTSFPALDASSGTNFEQGWRGCTGLTSFSASDMSSGTYYYRAWLDCSSLATFPADMFNATGTLSSNAFAEAWLNCALTAQSIENILVSLDTNGASSISLDISGGTNASKLTWSATAVTAYNNLVGKSWSIAFNP